MNRQQRIKLGEAFEEANALATAPPPKLPSLQFFTFECPTSASRLMDQSHPIVVVKSTSRKKAKVLAEEAFRQGGFGPNSLKKVTCINQVRIVAEDQIIFSDANGR